YRVRLGLSVASALLAAAFWSANIAVIYPVLYILQSGQSLQTWVDDKIDETQKEIDESQEYIGRLNKEYQQLGKIADVPASVRAKRERQLSSELAKAEGKLGPARKYLWFYQVAKDKIYRFLPDQPFRTLVWVIVAVIAAVAIKG